MRKGDTGQTSALYVWNGFSAFWGMSFSTSPHHHNTLQLVFDVERHFKLKDKDTGWKDYSAAIIKDGHTHQLDSNNSMQLFLYLDKDSRYAKQLSDKYLSARGINDLSGSDIRKLSNDFFKQLLAESSCDSLLRGCTMILQHLIDMELPVVRDERVGKAMDFILKMKSSRITVKEVAAHICLSESRTRHLFKEQVGQPIQNFMLWMKVVDSLHLLAKGSKVEETAYSTGFWDAAHMNRSYKTLLGVTPGGIRQLEGKIRIITCNDKNLYTIQTTILKDWNDDEPAAVIQA